MAPHTKVQTKTPEPKPFTHRTAHVPTIVIAANEGSPPEAALTLSLNGQPIRDRGEMLSLTDMWRAAGEDPNKKPADWSRKEGAAFIAHVAEMLNVPHGHIETKRGGSGEGRGATFAHWQIAIAYAKYLSNEFHAACNVVIREHMEGRHHAPAVLSPDLAEAIERTFGISRMSIHKVTAVEVAVGQMQQALIQTRAEFLQALMESDPRAVAVGFRPSLEVLKDHDVPSKGRRGLSQKITRRLLSFSAAHNHPMRESHETGRWLFHVDAIDAWLLAEGRSLIKDHIDKVTGQGNLLKLVKK